MRRWLILATSGLALSLAAPVVAAGARGAAAGGPATAVPTAAGFAAGARGAAAGGPATAVPTDAGFAAGAAQVDITPPALATPLGEALERADFIPACGLSEAQIEQLWPGRRLFAFEDPYIDLFNEGRYVPGDPFCAGNSPALPIRYQAPYIAGGSGEDHWPLTSADLDPAMNTSATTLHSSALTNDPITAQALVFSAAGRKVAVATVNSIGIFDSTMDQIRMDVERGGGGISAPDIFISSTHDESAPDPIGLWGPDLSGEPTPISNLNGVLPAGVTSGVDEYYMSWMEQRVASAVLAAERSLQPAELKLALARMPANTQSCWSSYPFIDSSLMPVMQGVSRSGRVIFTLVNVGTHDETLSFSGNPAYTSMLSGDWTGRLSQRLEADFPGSVGVEMAGLVGSVETPALYPEGTQVLDVPGRLHDVGGTPVDGCSSVYPDPGVAPYSDALALVDAYGKSVADTAISALSSPTAKIVAPSSVFGQVQPVCLQLENNLFAVAFALGLFPDRPAYADPRCTVGLALSGRVTVTPGTGMAGVRLAAPVFLRSEVGVLTMGPVQIAYSPGEVFPVTEIGGPYDTAQMPFPTDCYLPPDNYTCGAALPTTPIVSADMTEPWRFLAGLGEDMIGYLFPPSNFVGSAGETLEPPWSLYELYKGGGKDRFGYGHADDSESVGPNAGLAVTKALAGLLAYDGRPTTVVPGLFVDSAGRLCDSPFPTTSGSWVAGCPGFTGAVGVRIVSAGGPARDVLVGTAPGDASAWATYLATPDSGTAGTPYGYSTATRGVIVGGRILLIDVVAGEHDLLS